MRTLVKNRKNDLNEEEMWQMEDGEKNKMGVFWVKCLMKKGQGSVTLSLISDCQIVP